MPIGSENAIPSREATEGRREVKFSDLIVGMTIRIKQPQVTASDVRMGLGEMAIKESWIETKISAINNDPEDLFITTERGVDLGTRLYDEFTPQQLWSEDGVLHADPLVES